MFFVYILYSKSADKYYVGHTNNINLRIKKHNSPLFAGEFTRKNGQWELVYYESGFVTRSALRGNEQRERQIKKWKSESGIRVIQVNCNRFVR